MASRFSYIDIISGNHPQIDILLEELIDSGSSTYIKDGRMNPIIGNEGRQILYFCTDERIWCIVIERMLLKHLCDGLRGLFDIMGHHNGLALREYLANPLKGLSTHNADFLFRDIFEV